MVDDQGYGQPGGPGRPGDYSAPGIGGGAGEIPPQHGWNAPPATPPAQVGPTGPPGQGGAGAPPPAGLPPLPRRSEKKGKGSRGIGQLLLVAIVAAVIGAVVVMVAFPLAFGVNPWDIIQGKIKQDNKAIQSVATKGLPQSITSSGANGVASIAKTVIPSIVNIDITTAPQSNGFFSTGAQQGTGSGVIYTANGYIITNNHVVGDAQQITVTLASGESLAGKKVGTDPDNDIAVVKIDKTGLPAIGIGNSDSIVVGDMAVVVGSPFGFEQSVTSGIISALHRNVPTGDAQTGQSTTTLTNLIQTDAAINPGNSGGGLCDSNAQLVGINCMIATQSGGSEGVGFAIPVNTAKLVADDLIAGRAVSHPYLGVAGQSVSDTVAKQYNLPVNKGAYVTSVVQGSPGDKAGIKRGDIIVEMDGKPVNSMDELVAQVKQHKVGDKVNITYYQGEGGQKKTATVTLEEKPKNLQQ